MSNEPSHDETFRKEIEARVGRTLCQRYTLERVIGIGGIAAVYGGSHRNGNRVAIKVLHTELGASKEVRERFLREAYAANKVEHAGAVRVLDDDTTEEGLAFLVMELLEGETLEHMMNRQGGKLPASELVPFACQVLDVLAAAHEKGIVHRDIRPANIFITRSRALKIMDFGIARLGESSRLATRTGRAAGSAEYVAPEQARGETQLIDGQTDIWATGAMMFHALSGRSVYEAATPEMVIVQAATQPARPLRSVVPTCEADIAEIVDRALASKKEERWRNAQAMATALRSGRVAAVGQSAPPAPMAAPMPPQTRTAAIPIPPQAAFPQAARPAQSTPPPPQQSNAPPFGPQGSQGPQGSPAPPFQPPGPPPLESSTDNGWIKWVAAAAALVVLFVVGGALVLIVALRATHHAKPDPTAKGSATLWSDEDSPIPVSSNDPIWGNREALVTIVSFSDFQCPFCARVQPTLEQVKTTYGPDQVRIVWKNQPLPFHDKAKPAAEAAEIVFTMKGSDAFFKFHDSAFKNQSQLSAEKFEEWAVAAGVDRKAFETAYSGHAALPKIEADMALGKKVGATGTPSFRINGVELSGAQPFDKFKQVIDAELARASAKLATGTPKSKLYVALSTENFKQQPAKKDDEPAEDTTTVWRVQVFDSPVRGNVDAPVTIIEFGDFQCPYCKRSEQTIDKIRDTYGDKVRIVWKHEPLPFHPRAEPAAELALEARQQKGDQAFWVAHDKLFDAQPKLEDDDLAKLGAVLSLDGNKLRTALRDKKHKREIDADAELADDVQATGTPHFFVNGRRVVGSQPFEKFQKIIDEELRKFDAQQGTVSAKNYYASLMRDAKGPPDPEKKRAPAVPPGAPFRGGRDAKVVIQEWADFQCPFCVRAEPTLNEILKVYGDRVKIVWRDKPLPMHPDAALAAEAAREALKQGGQDGFSRMHDKLFANQQRLKRDDLDGFAKELGLDVGRFDVALDNHSHKQTVDADDKIGTDIGLTGTPAFLINSYYLSGAQPFPKFKKLIDRALTEPR